MSILILYSEDADFPGDMDTGLPGYTYSIF